MSTPSKLAVLFLVPVLAAVLILLRVYLLTLVGLLLYSLLTRLGV